MAEYKQPKTTPVPNVAGYPNYDVNKNDVTVHGKYPPGTGTKKQMKCRGGGAAVKGFDFHEATAKASDK